MTFEDEAAPFDVASSAPQRSADWFRERAGKATASRFRHVMAKLKKGGYAEARGTYMWELVIERITGTATDHYASTAMQWGQDNEAGARMAYEATTGAIVEEVGFFPHTAMENVGGSPDGLIGEDGGFEAKCPYNSAVHLMCFLEGMPEEHRAQVQGLMWITGRHWWDFVSFDPRLPEPFNLYMQRIERDEDFIAELEREVETFLTAVALTVDSLNAAARKETLQ